MRMTLSKYIFITKHGDAILATGHSQAIRLFAGMARMLTQNKYPDMRSKHNCLLDEQTQKDRRTERII